MARATIIITTALIFSMVMVASVHGQTATPTATPLPTATPATSPGVFEQPPSSVSVSPWVLSGSVSHSCAYTDDSVSLSGVFVSGNTRVGCTVDNGTQPGNAIGYTFIVDSITLSVAGSFRYSALTGNDLVVGTQSESLPLSLPKKYCVTTTDDLAKMPVDCDFTSTNFVAGSTKTDILFNLSRGSSTGTVATNFAISNLAWIAEGYADTCYGTAEIGWDFITGPAEWAAESYAWQQFAAGALTPGQLVSIGSGIANETSLTAAEIRNLLGNTGPILSDNVTLSFYYKGITTGSYSILARIYYTDGTYNTTAINKNEPVTGFYQATILANSGKEIQQVSINILSGADVAIDDIFLSIPCENLDNDQPPPLTPTPGATPTVGPSPTATPLPTPLPPVGNLPGDDDGLVPVCYSCPTPNNVLDIGLWIAKLICIIRNLFQCALKIWLLEVGNWIRAVYESFLAFISWLASVFQSFIGWVFSIITRILLFVAYIWGLFIYGITNFFTGLVNAILESAIVQMFANSHFLVEELINIFLVYVDAIIYLATSLYDALIAIIEIVFMLIAAVRDAFAGGPIEVGLGSVTLNSVDNGDLVASGFNESKVVGIFLIGAAAVDYAVGVFPLELIYLVVIGLLGYGLIMWTIKQWHDIFPT